MVIRPFQLPADLDLMASLIKGGFQYPENPDWSIQEDALHGMVEQLNGVKRIWPLVRFVQIISPSFRDLLCGFIYEENGQPAGLINYMRQRREPDWLIGNVTVLPAFRRRGIAKKLVERTIQELTDREARVAILDVVDGNVPALTLYRNIGFETYTSSIEYDVQKDLPVTPVPFPDGYTLASLKNGNWKAIYQFTKRITPESITLFEKISKGRFRILFLMRMLASLVDMVGGMRSIRVVVKEPNGDAFGWGRFRYRVREGGLNKAEFQIDPKHPELALPLLSQVIVSKQEKSPGRRIEFRLKDWQSALIDAAESLSCEKRYALNRMGLLFKTQ
jgi:ribosomal protein S18 acetylase RimI-like enzyme